MSLETTRSTETGGKQNGERGFTLIELSIVLVLIGLIIGSVLKGQELINSTRLKMTVSQWDAVKAAVNTFQDKYVALPGDYQDAQDYIDSTATYPEGDGNGIIDTGGAALTDFDDPMGNNASGTNEHQAAWQHLFDTSLLATVDINNDTLPGKLAGTNFVMYYGTHNSRTAHWLRLQKQLTTTTSPTVDPLSPKEAVEIDRKFDDEDFADGVIQAGKIATNPATTCAPDTISDDEVCTMVFELF